MRRTYLLALVLSSLAAAVAVACSSSNPTDDAGAGDASNDNTTQKDSNTNDVTTTNDASNDASKSDASDSGNPSDAGSDGAVSFTLTIRDYLDWCSVKVNGGTPSTADPQTFPFGLDASVALHGQSAADASFYWGYWQGPGIGDGGEILNQDVTLQITGDVTVHACCPDNGQPLTQCTF